MRLRSFGPGSASIGCCGNGSQPSATACRQNDAQLLAEIDTERALVQVAIK